MAGPNLLLSPLVGLFSLLFSLSIHIIWLLMILFHSFALQAWLINSNQHWNFSFPSPHLFCPHSRPYCHCQQPGYLQQASNLSFFPITIFPITAFYLVLVPTFPNQIPTLQTHCTFYNKNLTMSHWLPSSWTGPFIYFCKTYGWHFRTVYSNYGI